MTKNQKLAIKTSLMYLKECKKPTLAELEINDMLAEAFPAIAAELEHPVPQDKNQLEFPFVVDSGENVDTVRA